MRAIALLLLLVAVLGLHWNDFRSQLNTSRASQRYCMRWCDSSATFSEQIEYNYPLQTSGQVALNLTCCQVCTSDCFNVVSDSRISSIESDVTLATVSTPQRMGVLMKMRSLWRGPMVVVFHTDDYNDHNPTHEHPLLSDQLASIRKFALASRNTLVLVYSARYAADEATISAVNSIHRSNRLVGLLPINTLRNVAIDFTDSHYVFPVDVDFLPSVQMYDDMLHVIPELNQLDKAAVVVPHFETRACARKNKLINKISAYPTTFETLYGYLQKGLVRPFHADLQFFDWPDHVNSFQPKAVGCYVPPRELVNVKGNPWGVRTSNYGKWVDVSINETSPQLIPISADKSAKVSTYDDWEPFFMISRVHEDGVLMRYNELFVGRILNKVQWVSTLREQNYSFFTLKRQFLVHKVHKQSDFALEMKKQIPDFRSRMETALWANIEAVAEQINASRTMETAVTEPPVHDIIVPTFEVDGSSSPSYGTYCIILLVLGLFFWYVYRVQMDGLKWNKQN